MAELFHIACRDDWLREARTGEYRLSTRGVTLEEQGFIHCSLSQQLPAVADLVYGDVDDGDLVVLVIDSTRVAAELRFEAAAAGGEEYPHIYGPIPVSAVTNVIAFHRDAEGNVLLPE